MAKENNVWLYSVYRNSDDKLMALDVKATEAMEVMGLKLKPSFYHFMSVRNGMGKFFTVTKKRKEEVEEEMND